MTLRIPTLAEAEALAGALEAKGYPRAEAARNFRIAFPEDDPDGVDGCLMFEGPTIVQAEGWALEWSGLDDDGRDEHGSWLNALTFSAFLILAERAGEADAAFVRAEEFAYIRQHWTQS